MKHFPLDQNVSGAPEPEPFGENIESPDAREIPPAFHGKWRLEGVHDVDAPAEIIGADHINFGGDDEPVVAVRFINERSIAVVTQAMGESGWAYSLRYFGVSPDSTVLTDLESTDMKYVRA